MASTSTAHIPEAPDPRNLNQTDGQVGCQYCGKFYKGKRGLGIHIAKQHQEIHRDQISQQYQAPPAEIIADNPDLNPQYIDQDDQQSQESQILRDRIQSFEERFEEMANEELNPEKFEQCYKDLVLFLSDADGTLPGPKHPSSKFYHARKRRNKNYTTNDRKFAESSNPERASKRDRQKRNEQFQYDLMQYNYYHRRKKCVNQLMSSDKNPQCQIPMKDIQMAFQERWGTPNEKMRSEYGPEVDSIKQAEIDAEFNFVIPSQAAERAIRGINNDTAAGVDKITIRTIKNLKCEKILASITTIMIRHGYVPTEFKQARTTLTPKKGDLLRTENWRPISICSILRRVVERILDRVIKRYISISEHQRGFTNLPGTHINTALIAACLQKAKVKKMDISVVLLDIIKAFDMIGYNHLEQTIKHTSLPTMMKTLVMDLQTDNYTQIHVNSDTTQKIQLRKGLLQGAPLSPTLFNLSVDYIMRELTENEIAHQFGFPLVPTLVPLSAAGFADDTALIGNSGNSAVQLAAMAKQLFKDTGLEINPRKSAVIHIVKGKQVVSDLKIDDNDEIPGLKIGEVIKYLGVSFQGEMIFDQEAVINSLNNDLKQLVTSALLKPEQKLGILNQYLWPKVIYPFQTAPVGKIPQSFLEDMDKITRSSIREILGMPGDIPNSMLYSPAKYKGLALVRAKWEAPIQVHNICQTLQQAGNDHLMEVRDFEKEMEECRNKLGVTEEEYEEMRSSDADESETPKKISAKFRATLREREFDDWCALPQKGKGVALFKQEPSFNKWLMTKKGLSSSEWTSSIKMTANVAAVRVIPGRSTQTTRCRHCNEIETLGHVLGACEKGTLLRNARHHRIRKMIADGFRKTGLQVFEEVHCVSDTGSTRRLDIIAINTNKKSALVLDPTIRMETGVDQPESVNTEKKGIYDPCIPYLKDKYKLRSVEVIGLFIGSRGTITTFLHEFVKQHKLGKSLLDEIVISVLKSSAHILHNHLYSQ